MHPDTIKRLPLGYAAITSPAYDQPCIARINNPEDAETDPIADNVPRLDTPLLTMRAARCTVQLGIRGPTVEDEVRH